MINGNIAACTIYMRRKAGSLIPIETLILEAGAAIKTRSDLGFHGFMIAKEIKEREGTRGLTAHGTLYKALRRMEKAGFLESVWEDPLIAAEEGRPRRRSYNLTFAGELALNKAQAETKRFPAIGKGLLAA